MPFLVVLKPFLSIFLRFFSAGFLFIRTKTKNLESVTKHKYFKPLLLIASAITLFILFRNKETYTKKVTELKKMPDSSKKAFALAQSLAQMLGTDKSLKWWNYSSWTEDDQDAYELLKDNISLIHNIEINYNQISKSGSLIEDLKLLPNKQREEIINLIR